MSDPKTREALLERGASSFLPASGEKLDVGRPYAFSAFAAIVLNALEVRAHSDPPPVSPRASRDMSGTPEPPRGERGSPPGGSPETITPTALFANVTNGAAPSSSASGPSERTSSTKKLGLVKDQLEMVERRARDGTTRNEVRHPSRACLVRTDGASPRLLPRARKRVASDADSKRRAMTRRRPRSVPRGADDVDTTRARGSRRDDAQTPRRHVARLAVAPLTPLLGSARREDRRATDGGERHIEGSLFADSTAQSDFS